MGEIESGLIQQQVCSFWIKLNHLLDDTLATKKKKQDVQENIDLLEFKVGPYRFCAPATDVEAIIQPPQLTPVPFSSDIIAGCFLHQDKTATVLCLNTKLGIPVSDDRTESHIILSEVDGGLKGFWADIASDIVELKTLQAISDYYPHDLKAYEGFLVNSSGIMLQTTFERLYRCARSRMYWSDYLHTFTVKEKLAEEFLQSSPSDNYGHTAVATSGDVTDDDDRQQHELKSHLDNAANAISRKSGLASYGNPSTGFESDHDSGVISGRQALVANADFMAESPSKAGIAASSTSISFKENNTANEPGTGRVQPAVAGTLSASTLTGIHSNRPSSFGTSYGKRHARQGAYPHNTIHNRPTEKISTENYSSRPSSSGRQAAAHNTFRGSRPLQNKPSTPSGTAYGTKHRGEDYSQHGEREPGPERSNKNLLPLAAALLALAALGLGAMYMLEDENIYKLARTPKVISNLRQQSNVHSAPGLPETSTPTYTSHYFGTTAINDNTNSDTSTSRLDTADHTEPEQNTLPANSMETLNETRPERTGRVIEFNLTETETPGPVAETVMAKTEHYQYTLQGAREYTHVVIKGDTLWHITRRYLGNPYRYPELARSSHITNPHLIFPGDIIKIIIRKQGADR